MNEISVGRIKNVTYDQESDQLEVTVTITDKKYQKKLLRDLSLSGSIRFEGNTLIYVDNSEGEEK